MRAVFFDLDGTLVELPDDFLELFETAMADHGVDADDRDTEVERAECYTEAFFDYLGECHSEPYRMAMADLRERFDLVSNAEESAPSAEALAESYTEREAEMTDLAPGVHEALDALDAPDTAFGVLTNGGARGQHRKLAHHGIADYFEAVVVSGDVGAGKPDADIFAAAKETIPADEYVFVADDLKRDVLPAQEAGFTGVHLTSEGNDGDAAREEDATDAGEADATVSSLRAVPDLLG